MNILSESELMRTFMTKMTEGVEDIKIYALHLWEARGDQNADKFSFLLPGSIQTEDDFEELLEVLERFIWPSTISIEDLLTNLRAGQMVVYENEEGVVGMTPNREEYETLKIKVLTTFTQTSFDDDY